MQQNHQAHQRRVNSSYQMFTMLKKYILYLCIVSMVTAAEYHHQLDYQDDDKHGPVEYEFSYHVHDPHTGDIKSQKESRKGHTVEGSYELIDSDGHKRIVKYSADKHSGFQAHVIREPTDIKIPIPERKPEYHYGRQAGHY